MTVDAGEGEAVGEAPMLRVGVGVGEREGSTTPCTNSGPAYIVPALVTLFQTFVVKVPAVAPVHTLTSVSRP